MENRTTQRHITVRHPTDVSSSNHARADTRLADDFDQLFIMGTGFVDTVMAGRYSCGPRWRIPRRQRALAEFHAAHRHCYGAVAYYVTTASAGRPQKSANRYVRLWLCLVSGTLLVSFC